jgi:hypothetical protein
MKQDDYFKKFRNLKSREQGELCIDRVVNILWSDPYAHFHQLHFCLQERGMACNKAFPVGNAIEGSDFFIADGIRIFYSGQQPELIPEEHFDICVVSRCHGEPANTTHATAVSQELFPYTEHAEYTVYRDCCHGESVKIANQFNISHAVSDAIAYNLLAEMVIDMLNNDYSYIELGTDFKKAAELAAERKDDKKSEIYQWFEKNKLK